MPPTLTLASHSRSDRSLAASKILEAFQSAQAAVKAGDAAGVGKARDAVRTQLVAIYSQVRARGLVLCTQVVPHHLMCPRPRLCFECDLPSCAHAPSTDGPAPAAC